MYNHRMEKNKIRTEKDKRQLFDLKHRELELRRNRLQLQVEREELEAKVTAIGASARRKAKKAAKKAAYDVKYVYVAGGHFKNELIGFLTVFNADRARNMDIKRHIEYDPDDKRLYLDVYQRNDRDLNKTAKVFVYIHGGGWIGGSPETREGFTTRIADAGYFVVSIFYGYSPFYAHPKPLENIYKAFAWIKENAAQYNLDAESIFVGGESAGAHLSSMVGAVSTNGEYKAHFNLDARSRDQKIRGLVLNCGVYNMEKAVSTGFKNIGMYTQSYCGGVPLAETSEEFKKEISPINWVTAAFPPTYAISAENDKLAVLTFDLVEKLYDLHVPVTHYHGEGKLAVHAFAVAQCLKITKEAMSGAYAFLAEESEK